MDIVLMAREIENRHPAFRRALPQCNARFLSLDFPGYFYAFSPLASELMADHATRS
jgi:hypothetical protein